MKTLTFTDDEWRDLIAWADYVTDESYAMKIAAMIIEKIRRESE